MDTITADAPTMDADTITADAPTVATVEELRAALATLSAGKLATDAATGTAKLAILSRYGFHAARLGRAIKGKRPGDGSRFVLPVSMRKELSRKLWADAGRGDIPKTADRTPGEKSFATYLSNLHTVATDESFGIPSLATWEDVDAARETIRAAKSADADAAARKLASIAHDDYVAWLDAVPTPDRDAIKRAARHFADNAVSFSHFAAFGAVVLTSARDRGVA